MPLAHTAFLFPGQASQYVGMGRQVLESRPDMGVYFDIASDILHQDVRKLMFEGPLETLTQTEYAQPAILLASYISYKLFNQVPETAAGHSLGEFSALCAAGALCFADAVELVNKRGKYMQEACPVGEGKMAAVIGASLQVIEDRLEQEGNPVNIANINSPIQIVLSGQADAIGKMKELFADFRVVELKVSAPFHSDLMAPAADLLAADLERIEIKEPAFPVYANVTAKPYTSVAQIRKLLVDQVTKPVLFTHTIANMRQQGIEQFIEVGPNKVLTGLLKRIDRKIKRRNIETAEDVAAFSA